MSLFATLGTAGRALGVMRVAHATASHNVENASTPGYSRQRVELHAAQPASFLGGSFLGTGVHLGSVTAVRDRFLDEQVPAAMAASSFSAAASQTFTALNTLDPDDQFGLPASLGNFFAAVRQLSLAPADGGYRRSAVEAAGSMARALNRSSQEVVAARSAADQELQAQAQDATRLAERVASLNAEVRRARGAGAEPNDLVDARRLAAEELSALTGARLSEQDGDLTVQLGATALVVGDRAASFATSADPSIGGHLALTVQSSGGGTTTLGDGQVGGRIGGLLHGRDSGLGAVEARLDELAFDFATSVNAAHQAGIALDGSSGRDLFVVGVQAGAAGRIAVTQEIADDPTLLGTSATGAPGDNGGVMALLATESSALASGDTPAGALSTLIGDFGAAARSALHEADAAAATLSHVSGLRDAASGVSIDEELVELTKVQRNFEAVSKVLQTTDQMLNELLSLR